MKPEQILRFTSKIDKSRGACGCWLWQGAKSRTGYGHVRLANRTQLAHRIAYLIAHGPYTAALYVLHNCDTPACCNPFHLVLGTQLQNMAHRVARGRDKEGARKGIGNGRAKLSDDQVRAIRADTRSQRLISEIYDVGQSTISRVKRGEGWSHI